MTIGVQQLPLADKLSRPCGVGIALALLSVAASFAPADAASWTPPGVTMGLPLGAAFAPGVYASNLAHYGSSPSKTVEADIPSLTVSPGWQFLGASYQASILVEGLAVSIPPGTRRADVFNPLIIPLFLSWKLAPGWFVSFGQGVYAPVNTSTALTTLGRTSGTGFEERVALSYVRNDWILTANSIFGVSTPDASGLQQPDYFNIDWTVAHTFGNWEFGVVGFAAWDVEKTAANANLGRGHIAAVGGLIGYNFGGPSITVEATHAVSQGGSTNYGKDDTRAFARLTIPVWQPASSRP